MWKVSAGAGEEQSQTEQLDPRGSASGAAALLRQTLTPPAEKPSLRQPPNQLLRLQIAICAALLLFLFAARQLGWPVFEVCRAGISTALEQGIDLSEQAELVRFANGIVEDLRLKAAAWADGRNGAAEETPLQESEARPPVTSLGFNGKEARSTEPPAGYSLKSYVPLQPLRQPLSEFYVTSGYGWRSHPISKTGDFHTGIDLAAAEGTQIGAVLPGIVLNTGRGRSYGNYVVLLHSDGVATRYCHMQYVFVRRGESVEQGSVLGTVGSTGMATGPHLHFELSFDDTHYDPARALGL